MLLAGVRVFIAEHGAVICVCHAGWWLKGGRGSEAVQGLSTGGLWSREEKGEGGLRASETDQGDYFPNDVSSRSFNAQFLAGRPESLSSTAESRNNITRSGRRRIIYFKSYVRAYTWDQSRQARQFGLPESVG